MRFFFRPFFHSMCNLSLRLLCFHPSSFPSFRLSFCPSLRPFALQSFLQSAPSIVLSFIPSDPAPISPSVLQSICSSICPSSARAFVRSSYHFHPPLYPFPGLVGCTVFPVLNRASEKHPLECMTVDFCGFRLVS